MAKRERQKLNYRFHDPNPPGVMAEHAAKVFAEVNWPKAEEAFRKALEALPAELPGSGGKEEFRKRRAEAAAQNTPQKKPAQSKSFQR